jgi:transposase InsO family protein
VHKILRRHGGIAAYNQRGIARRFTKPHRPWTNGKAGRFNRTLQTE